MIGHSGVGPLDSAVLGTARRGNTALTLDPQGRITRLTVVYDSSLFSDADYHNLAALAAEG